MVGNKFPCKQQALWVIVPQSRGLGKCIISCLVCLPASLVQSLCGPGAHWSGLGLLEGTH